MTKPYLGMKAKGDVLGPCPSCGLRVQHIMDADGNAIGLGHDEPTCARFDAMDPTAFLALWNDELERLDVN